MKNRFTYLFFFLVIFIMNGCDKEDAPFLETPAIVPANPDNTPVRKVLLEKFTGHTCGNCPDAGVIIEKLKALYNEQLVVYAIHGDREPNFYSEPQESKNGNYFYYDFRTPEGTELAANFNASYLPTGMINRKEVSSGIHTIGRYEWGSVIDNIISTPPDLSITLSSTYNSPSRELTITVSAEFLNVLNGIYYLSVFLTEDSIINWQYNGEEYADPNYPIGDVENYVHRHNLRGAMNNTWGEEIANGSITVGDTISKTYTTTVDTEWNENQMSIVAFVYDFTTKEVLQAEEIHLQH